MPWSPPMLEARLHLALPTRFCHPATGAGCRSKEFAVRRCWIQTRRLAQLHGLSHISKMSIHLARGLSPASTMKLFKLTSINDHAINLVEKKQTLYGPTYSLGPVELETLKTYVEINLASGFIRSFTSQRQTSELLRPYQTLCFIQLDRSAHHGKKTCEGNNLKTAFRTRNGCLKYQTMRLPANIPGYVNKTLAKKLDIKSTIFGATRRGRSFPSKWEPFPKAPSQTYGGFASIKMRTDFWELAWAQVITRGASAKEPFHPHWC